MRKITLGIIALLGTFVATGQTGRTCDEAIEVTSGEMYQVNTIDGEAPKGSNTCYYDQHQAPLIAANAVWYKYTNNTNEEMSVTISSNLSENAGKDTRLSIYKGDCAYLDCVPETNEHFDDVDYDGNNKLSVGKFVAKPNKTYYFIFDNMYDSSEEFIFEVSAVSLSTNTVKEKQFTHYVADNTFNITAIYPIESIVIYNLLGKKVLVENLDKNEAQINIANLQSGVYIAQINISGKVQTIKFVK